MPLHSPLSSPCPIVDGHKGWVIPEANLAEIPTPPLSCTTATLHPQSTLSHHPALSLSTPPASARPSSTSSFLFETRSHPREHPSGLRRRRQASHCCLALDITWTPPSMPNGLPLPVPSVDPSLARAPTAPVHALDAESGTRVLKRVHTQLPRKPCEGAQHHACITTPPSPCTP
jgi:hypothetical protein